MQVGTNARKVAAVLVACGLSALSGQTLGASATESWPTASTLPRAEGKATVLMFVQSTDPRSEAKVAQLAAIVATSHQHPFVAVVHVADSQPGALWDASGKVPHAARLLDKGGVEAHRFNATETGFVVVYDARGALEYAGNADQLFGVLAR